MSAESYSPPPALGLRPKRSDRPSEPDSPLRRHLAIDLSPEKCLLYRGNSTERNRLFRVEGSRHHGVDPAFFSAARIASLMMLYEELDIALEPGPILPALGDVVVVARVMPLVVLVEDVPRLPVDDVEAEPGHLAPGDLDEGVSPVGLLGIARLGLDPIDAVLALGRGESGLEEGDEALADLRRADVMAVPPVRLDADLDSRSPHRLGDIFRPFGDPWVVVVLGAVEASERVSTGSTAAYPRCRRSPHTMIARLRHP